MERLGNRPVRVYVVWVPMFGGEVEDVAGATRVAPDSGVRHYWDGENRLGEDYRAILDLRESAWDVFMLYDRSARWTGPMPPRPAYWMHQLPGVTAAPPLEPGRFIAKAEELLR